LAVLVGGSVSTPVNSGVLADSSPAGPARRRVPGCCAGGQPPVQLMMSPVRTVQVAVTVVLPGPGFGVVLETVVVMV
jgi:hypothetical protein